MQLIHTPDMFKSLPVYVMMIGIPASGKSTYRDLLKVKQFPTKFTVLSSDDIIEDYALKNKKSYNAIFFEQIKIASLKVDKIRDMALNDNLNIIDDRTNVFRSGRIKRLEFVPKHYKKIAICLNVTEKIAMKHNNTRPENRRIDISVMDTFIKNFQLPSNDEGFDFIAVSNSIT